MEMLRLLSTSTRTKRPIHTGREDTNLPAIPLMLLASSVNTPIRNSRFHLLASAPQVQCGLGPECVVTLALSAAKTVQHKQTWSTGFKPQASLVRFILRSQLHTWIYWSGFSTGSRSKNSEIWLILTGFAFITEICGGNGWNQWSRTTNTNKTKDMTNCSEKIYYSTSAPKETCRKRECLVALCRALLHPQLGVEPVCKRCTCLVCLEQQNSFQGKKKWFTDNRTDTQHETWKTVLILHQGREKNISDLVQHAQSSCIRIQFSTTASCDVTTPRDHIFPYLNHAQGPKLFGKIYYAEISVWLSECDWFRGSAMNRVWIFLFIWPAFFIFFNLPSSSSQSSKYFLVVRVPFVDLRNSKIVKKTGFGNGNCNFGSKFVHCAPVLDIHEWMFELYGYIWIWIYWQRVTLIVKTLWAQFSRACFRGGYWSYNTEHLKPWKTRPDVFWPT